MVNINGHWIIFFFNFINLIIFLTKLIDKKYKNITIPLNFINSKNPNHLVDILNLLIILIKY